MWPAITGLSLPWKVGLVAVVAGLVFAAGSWLGWHENGIRWENKYQARELTWQADARQERDRQARDLAEKNLHIGELDREITAAHQALAEAASRPRVDSLSLRRARCPTVPAASHSGPASVPAGANPAADALGGTDRDSGALDTRPIYALTDRGDACLVALKGWRDYAKLIGAVQ
ncbi:MAG: hypothetical protein Q8N51_00960 [Gammaproteobacteria bacterium]|nr:hypothetical protein [Gammaproteobacteria bacterium]